MVAQTNPSKWKKGLMLFILSILVLFLVSGYAYYYVYWINPSIDLPNTIHCGGAAISDRMTQICKAVSPEKYSCDPIEQGGGDTGQTCHLKK